MENQVYSKEFVEKIKQSEQEYKNGQYVTVKSEDLAAFLGLE